MTEIYKGRELSATESAAARAYVRRLVERVLETDDWTAKWSNDRLGKREITLRWLDPVYPEVTP